MAKLLSLIVPSRRPHQLDGLLDSIERMTRNPANIEVIVKIDDDMPEAASYLAEEKARRPFEIKVVRSPRLGGFYTLWVGLEEAFALSDSGSYFVMTLTDEGRFLTRDWDVVLSRYVGFFSDDVFRLRISACKYVSYSDPFQCSTMPESFAIFTRTWLTLTEGIGNLCYGSDTYHQAIAFHLGLGLRSYNDLWHREALFRDVPVIDIEFGGMEFGRDVPQLEAHVRMLFGVREWLRLISYPEQRRMTYLARRIHLYVWAREAGIERFRFERRDYDSTIHLIDSDSGERLRSVSFRPPRLRVYLFNLKVRLLLVPWRVRQLASDLIIRLKYGADLEKAERNAPRRTPQEQDARQRRLQRYDPFRWLAWMLTGVNIVVDFLMRPVDTLTRSPPAGLQRMSRRNPFGFAAKVSRTGYPIPDRSEMRKAHARILGLQTELRDKIFEATSIDAHADERKCVGRSPF
jgi:hypothetical protein